MGRVVVPLSATKVDRLTYGVVQGKHRKDQKLVNEPGTPRTAYHAVGGEGCEGLNLMCQPPKVPGTKGARSWIMRVTINGRQRQIGLGSYPAVSLERARKKGKEIRSMVANGIDPLESKRLKHQQRQDAERQRIQFESLAREYMEKRLDESGARDAEKKIQKELNQLKRYAFASLGRKIVSEITAQDVADATKQPLLEGKKETHDQIRRNIRRVMNLAKARGLYHGDNPADASVLSHLLPTPKGKKKKLGQPKHHPAVQLADAGRMYASLSNDHTLGARLLQFQMLTATRPGEARHAKWKDIDLANRVWHVPAEDMKMGVAHDVPLNNAAVMLIQGLGREGEYLFGERPPSENTANNRLKTLHQLDIDSGGRGFFDATEVDATGSPKIATAHGMRSCFKEWARSQADKYRDELSEIALAHGDGNENRSAYARGKLLDERVPMMADWHQFLERRPKKVS